MRETRNKKFGKKLHELLLMQWETANSTVTEVKNKWKNLHSTAKKEFSKF